MSRNTCTTTDPNSNLVSSIGHVAPGVISQNACGGMQWNKPRNVYFVDLSKKFLKQIPKQGNSWGMIIESDVVEIIAMRIHTRHTSHVAVATNSMMMGNLMLSRPKNRQ